MKQLVIFCLLCLYFSSAHSAIIIFSNGDTINAEVIERTDTSIKISHSAMGEIDIPTNQISTIDGKVFAAKPIDPPEAQQIDVASAEQQADTKESGETKKIDESSGLFGVNYRPLRDWEHKLGGGFNGKNGNTNTETRHVEYRGNFENKQKRWDIRAIYDFNDGDEDDAQNEYYLQDTRDWLRPDSEWFYFASGKYEWDEFSSWDYRITGVAGSGYEFIKRKDLLVLGRLGLAAKQTVGGSNPGLDPEFMLGGDVNKTFSDVHSVKFKTAFFQGLSNTGWRNISTLDWDIVVNELWGLGLNLGLENEYESIPDDGDVNNDFKYKLSFVWAWGGKDGDS